MSRYIFLMSNILLCSATMSFHEPAHAQTPIRTQDFINSQGVNTHIPYTDGAYANTGNIIADLEYLGINHVRDSINSPGFAGSAGLSAYENVANAGVHFALTVGGGGSFASTGGTTANPSLDMRIGYIDQLEQAVPESVELVEGTNEVNNQPIVYNGIGSTRQGTDELDAAVSLQHDIYAAVHSDPVLSKVSVAYFTGYAAGTIPTGPDPFTTQGLADFDNQHPYPNYGQAPAFWVSRSQALGNEAYQQANNTTTPAVYTETGYSSVGGNQGGVDNDVQAKYTMELLLDTASQGITQTYLYELLDAYAPGSPQGDAYYGLFDYTGKPKPVAVGLHNMNALLADKSTLATTFVPKALAYSVTGESSLGHHLLMQKSDGTYVLALWNEQPIWNESSASQLHAVAHRVEISLGNQVRAKTVVFDPVRQSSFTGVTYLTKIPVTVMDSPIFLLMIVENN